MLFSNITDLSTLGVISEMPVLKFCRSGLGWQRKQGYDTFGESTTANFAAAGTPSTGWLSLLLVQQTCLIIRGFDQWGLPSAVVALFVC